MTHERKDGKTEEKNEARTPPSLFKKLDDIYHFQVDAAATAENALTSVSIGYDAITIDWVDVFGKARFYCNPPYSNPAPFIKKAYEESLKGAIVVMLLPMDSSTKAFHEYCMKAHKWIIFRPRVKFLHPDGTPAKGAPKFGSFACVFDESKRGAFPVVESMEWK